MSERPQFFLTPDGTLIRNRISNELSTLKSDERRADTNAVEGQRCTEEEVMKLEETTEKLEEKPFEGGGEAREEPVIDMLFPNVDQTNDTLEDTIKEILFMSITHYQRHPLLVSRLIACIIAYNHHLHDTSESDVNQVLSSMDYVCVNEGIITFTDLVHAATSLLPYEVPSTGPTMQKKLKLLRDLCWFSLR